MESRSRLKLSSTSKTHLHFPGLNTFRFYAATAVIVQHVSEQFPESPGQLRLVRLFFPTAQSAVNLFFVLSGFLITYLLLSERQRTGTINVGKFYTRRVLRIFPLYYFIAFLGLILFPILFGSAYPLSNLPSYKIVLAFSLFPNFAGISAPMVHLWSIGVEEQYYSVWPWVAQKDSNIIRTSIGILIIKMALTPVIASFDQENVLTLFYGMRFECMAIGALGAYIYSRKPQYTEWIHLSWVQVFAIGAFIFLIVADIPVNTYNNIWTSLVFIVLIMNTATNPHAIIKLDYPAFEKLGKISYGLYLFHFPVLYLIYFTAPRIGLELMWGSPEFLLLCTLAGTWVIATLSYRYLESPFLRVKKKFEAI